MDQNKKSPEQTREKPRHEDPLTGEPGAHPLGTGLGTVLGGAAVGAAAGVVGGPLGTVAGAVVGGITGGLLGKDVAERIDPTAESAYWAENFRSQPYYVAPLDYSAYEPAYRMGWSNYQENVDWAEREPNLKKSWEEQRWENEGGQPQLTWEQAKQAMADAYERVAQQQRNSSSASPQTPDGKPASAAIEGAKSEGESPKSRTASQ